MSHGDDSDSSYNKSFVEEESKPPLRKPRMSIPSSSEERTESPRLVKSVLQKKFLGQSGAGSSAAFSASPNKAQQAFKSQNKSALSPDAPEFVPRTVITTTPLAIRTPSVQGRLNKNNLSDTYNSPNNLNRYSEEDYSNHSLNNGMQNIQLYGDGVKPMVETLESFAINLARDPGLYDNVLETFMSFLRPYITDPINNIMVISDTASMLFMHSVENINFRYSGARLCITIAECSPEFQVNLILLCEKYINCNTHDLKGLLLFIAELYMNEIDNSHMYGNMLINGFDVLLSTSIEDNIIAACQIIKLTGSKFFVEMSDDLENILYRLEQLKPLMKNNIQSLIESVKKNCQILVEETTNSDPIESDLAFIPGMEEVITLPIYIGENGEEVGIDEENYSGEDDPDIEEMYPHFEEFLKLQNK